jgi:predicted transcriptional regulator
MECKILLLIYYLQEVLRVNRFRWAACQLNALENCLDYRTLQRALVSLPQTLDETYARILRSIPEEHKQNAIRILQFLIYSERPLRIEEAVDALVVDIKEDQYFHL